MDVAAFLLALVPIIWLVVMLLCFKWPAWKAAIGSFVLSCLLAFAWWHLPAAQIATASLEGFLMALWPIVLVIIAAVFTYNLCVRTGAMDVIGSMITSISSDRRLLALLVAWCFGGFMEGMAGFGTAVAIPAGMLAGLGFEAVPAVLICLLANGVPTPYGSIGIPTVSVADLVGLDSLHLATVQLVQLAPFFVMMPLFIVLVAGRVADDQGNVAGVAERLRGVAGIAVLSGVSFAGAALVVARFVGPELAVVVGVVVGLNVNRIADDVAVLVAVALCGRNTACVRENRLCNAVYEQRSAVLYCIAQVNSCRAVCHRVQLFQRAGCGTVELVICDAYALRHSDVVAVAARELRFLHAAIQQNVLDRIQLGQAAALCRSFERRIGRYLLSVIAAVCINSARLTGERQDHGKHQRDAGRSLLHVYSLFRGKYRISTPVLIIQRWIFYRSFEF